MTQHTTARPAQVPARPVSRPPARRGPPARYGGWTPWLYLAPALAVVAGLLVYPVSCTNSA